MTDITISTRAVTLDDGSKTTTLVLQDLQQKIELHISDKTALPDLLLALEKCDNVVMDR